MKFGKSLGIQIEETLPEWRDKFLSYKDLKKRLKLIAVVDRPAKRPRTSPRDGAPDGDPPAMTKEEEDFLKLLEDELEKFNAFFVEKEEEYIIRQKELHDRVARAKDSDEEELMKVRKEIVDFHGEMVLLENYSALNYTAVGYNYATRVAGILRSYLWPNSGIPTCLELLKLQLQKTIQHFSQTKLFVRFGSLHSNKQNMSFHPGVKMKHSTWSACFASSFGAGIRS